RSNRRACRPRLLARRARQLANGFHVFGLQDVLEPRVPGRILAELGTVRGTFEEIQLSLVVSAEFRAPADRQVALDQKHRVASQQARRKPRGVALELVAFLGSQEQKRLPVVLDGEAAIACFPGPRGTKRYRAVTVE